MEAIEKLKKEKHACKNLSKKAEVVKNAVYTALCDFCKHQEFAQAVEQTDKTFQECCETCVKGTGNAVSDLELYRRAAQFYFDGADVQFHMHVHLPGDPPHDEQAHAHNQTNFGMSVSLDELLDF